MTDWVIRLKYFPASSLSSMAQVIWSNVFTHRNAML